MLLPKLNTMRELMMELSDMLRLKVMYVFEAPTIRRSWLWEVASP